MSGRKTTMWERGLSLLLAVVMTVSGTGLTAFATDVIPDEPDTSVTEEIQDTAEPAEAPAAEPTEAPVAEPTDEPGEAPTEAPVAEPTDEPGEAPTDEPVAEPTDEPVAEPEEEFPAVEPTYQPLFAELKTEEKVTYTFSTEDEVILAEISPVLRLWNEKEDGKYKSFTDNLPEDEQIVAAFALSDGTEDEIPVAFLEKAEVFFTNSEWDWSELDKAEVEESYTLYLVNTKGELKPVDFEVLFADDEDNEHGDALSFEADTLSAIVLTEQVKDEPEVYDNLVEVEASDSEPLLAEGALTAQTRRLLGISNGLLRAPKLAAGNGTASSADGVKIEKLTVRWLSKSTGSTAAAGFDQLELAPETDEVPNQQFQIDFALSGKDSYEPGAIELVFPAYIWLDRDGKEPGTLTLSVPEDPETGAEFAWRRVGDNILITNTKRLSAASTVLIQGTFRDVEAHTMRVEQAEEGQTYRCDSDDLAVTINVVTPEDNVLTLISNKIQATLSTAIRVAAATKTAYSSASRKYNIYFNANSVPQALLPENPDDYFYVRWYVSGTASGNQPFTMTVSDTAEDAYDCVMLGVDGAVEGTVPSEDGKTVTATLYNGYSTTVKSADIWTAYPYSAFPDSTEETFQLHNTQTITVTGTDDGVVTTKQAEGVVTAKMPTVYTFIKEWDDGDSERRPAYIYLDIYDEAISRTNPWRTVKLEPDADGNWIYQWNDEGQDRQFSVRERLVNASGQEEDRYDDAGNRHHYWWSYTLKSTDYNGETHTWTYVNEHTEGDTKYNVSNFSKYAEYQYSDTSRQSKRDNALNQLLKGKEVEVMYTVGGSIAMAKWTVHDHKTPVTAVVEDHLYWLNGEQVTVDDVEISAVALKVPTVYHYQNYDAETGLYESHKVEEDQTVLLYGYIGDEWVQMATMTGTNITVTAGSGASKDGSRINLPSGVSQVKTELETSEAIVNMSYNVYLRVKPTEQILSAIEEAFEVSEYAMFSLRNEAEAYCTYQDEKIISMENTAIAYLHGRNYKVATDLDKQFTYGENDTVNQRIRLHTTLTLTQQSNVPNLNDYVLAVIDGTIPNTTSGTYYDLLPAGVEPDLDSITLSGSDKVVEAYAISNYQGSGRTMLVVKVALKNNVTYSSGRAERYRGYSSYPSEGYKNTHTLDFDAFYSWSAALDDRNNNLSELRNTAAYEADEDSLGSLKSWEGEPDDPSAGKNVFTTAAVGNDAAYFTNLDEDRDAPAFAYAGATVVDQGEDVSAVTSLSKQVMAVGFALWGSGTGDNPVVVQEGGQYVYRLQVQSVTDVSTKNIILFDSIENYVPQENDGEKDVKPQWHGTLLSVDVSQMEAAGVAPVIYYSTVEGLDLSTGNSDLSDTSIWTTTAPAKLSEVTAIAIDATKDTNGNDFELNSGEILMAYLKMQAPSGADVEQYLTDGGNDPTQNGHAYNNVYLSASYSDAGRDPFIHYDYTKVSLISRSFTVTKVWDDENNNDGLRADSVTVRLSADGEEVKDADGDPLTLTLNEENGWTGEFKHLQTYDENGKYITYTFSEDPVEHYEASIEREGDQITVVNHHDLLKTEVPVTKLWTGDEENGGLSRPASITVRLLANGVFTGKTLVLRADDEGEWKGTFTDLNQCSDGKDIVYTVEEVPTENYIPSADQDTHTITNRYYPYGDLIVSKEVRNVTDQSADTEFTFTLTLTDSEGVDVIDRYAYTINDSDGNELSTGKLGNGGEFTLQGGQSLTLKDIPTGVRYAVAEKAAAGFTLVSASSASGTIHSYAPAEAKFVNEYHTSGSLDLQVNKTLEGRRSIQRYQFRFQVEEDDTVIRTASVDAQGTALFSAIRYTEADNGVTYTYKVTEIDRGKPGYTYDDSEITVQVTPHDNGDGTMTCETHYFKGQDELLDDAGNPVTAIPFTNSYQAEGTFTFRAWKTLSGGDLEDGQFTFELVDEHNNPVLDADGNPLQAKNNAKGEIVWTPITFTQDDAFTEDSDTKTFLYVAREVPGDDETVIYSTQTMGYEIEVVDNGDGTLSFNQINVNVHALTETESCARCAGSGRITGGEVCPVCGGTGEIVTAITGYEKDEGEAGLPVFTNGLEDGALSVTKYTTWTDIEPDADQEFTFHVQFIGENIDENTAVNYTKEQVENDPNAQPATNPTPARSNPTTGSIVPTTTELYDFYSRGNLSDTVKWTVYKDGTLVIEPTNGVSGTFEGKTIYSDWPYKNYITKITRAVVKDGVKVTDSTAYMFFCCTSLTSVDLSGLDTSSVTYMGCMFSYCSSLTSLDLSGLDTSSVTDMSDMFLSCSSLTKLDVSRFDTSSGTSTDGMFAACTSLSRIILGTNFSFKSQYSPATLPTPPTNDDYTGLWVRQGEPDTARTASELEHDYNSALAGTWIWQSVGYTVKFVAPEGAGGSMATLHYDPHVEFTLPANSFYLYENDFLGWDADGDGEVDYEDQATLTAGAVGEVLTLTAVFAPVDHTTVLNNGGFDLKLKGGEKATITGIPAGTAYQVWEETESGWVLVSQENVSGNIAPLETAEAKFTNNYQPGTATVALVGAKTLDGAAASAGAFSFQLKEGSKVLETISNSDGGFIQFTPITYTVKDVGRHVYTVSEVRGGNSAIDYDTHTEQIVVVVSGDADSLTATVSSNGFKFANTTRPGSLEITKIGEGVNDANEDTEFTFRVRLTNDSGQPLTDGDGYNWYVKGSQPASNPTPARSNPTTGSSIVPTTTEVGFSGNLSDTVKWTQYTDGTLVIEPTEGRDSGEFDGTVYGSDWPWYSYTGDVKRVVVRGNVKVNGSTKSMFDGARGLTELDLSGLDTSNVTDMSYMFSTFYNYNTIEHLDLSGWDTSNVTNMAGMFYGRAIKSVDMSGLDMSSVTDMSDMFSGCSSLTTLDLSDVDTSNVTNMSRMFHDCSSLTTLDLSDVDTNSVTDMSYMFSGCSSLTTLDVSEFDTNSVTNMQRMFSGCSSLKSLDVSNFDTSNVTKMGGLFYNCAGLTSLDVSGFDTSNVTELTYYQSGGAGYSGTDYGMFARCSSLTTLDLSGWDTSNVTNMKYLFSECSSLTSLDVSGWDTSKVTVMGGMFYHCSSLISLDLSSFETSACHAFTYYYNNGRWGTGTSYYFGMFEGCSSLTSLDLSHFDTNNTGNYDGPMYKFFLDCNNLSSVKLGESFTFKDRSGHSSSSTWALLPTPPHSSTTGRWVKLEDDGDGYSRSSYDLRDNYNGELDAGTWVWEVLDNTCLIHFDANGGFTSSGSIIVQDMATFVTLPDESTTSRPGYDLLGWNTKADGTGTAYGFGETTAAEVSQPGKSVTLYAQWVEEGTSTKYVIEHYQQNTDLNTYTLAGKTTTRVVNGGELSAAATYPGFQSSNRQTTTTQADGSILVRYYYDRATYTLRFDANGGSGSMSNATMLVNIAAALPTNRFTKTDALFIGWNTKADGSGDSYVDGQTVNFDAGEGEEITLYAQWMDSGYNPADPTNGEFIVTAKAGETIVIPGLPAGTRYEIEEIDVPNGWTQTDATGTDGSIQANTVSAAAITNAYSAKGYATISAHKQLEGGTVAPGQFLFELSHDDVGTVTKYAHTPNVADDGTVDPNYVGYDGRSYSENVTIPGAEKLYVRVEYSSDSPASVAVFKGEYPGRLEYNENYIGDFWDTGTWEGEISGDTVSFGIVTRGGGENHYFYAVVTGVAETTSSERSANGPIDTVSEITDENGNTVSNPWYGTAPVLFDSIEITEPGTYTYYIREIAGEDSTIIYDAEPREVIVTATDNGDGTLSTEVTYPDGNLFTNEVRTGALTVSKTVKNATAAALVNGQFTFRLSLIDANGNALTGTYPVTKAGVDAGTVGNGGTVTIGAGESFTVSGLPHGCRYNVTEVAVNGFELTAAENDEGVIDVSHLDGQTATFENTYSTSGSVTLRATKTLLGGKLQADQFQFSVVDSDGRTLGSAYSDENGNIAFPIDYGINDDGHTYTYYISEVAGDDERIVYDDHTEEVKVTVSDNGDGTMTATAVYDEDGAVFVNNRFCTLTISKTVDGNMGDRTTAFPFTLTLTQNDEPYTAEIAAPEGIDDWTAAGEGVYTFTLTHGESLELLLPGGVAYEVTEDAPEDYEATVSITDADGAEIENAANAPTAAGSLDGDRSVSFTNTRESVVPTGAEMTALPTVIGVIAAALAGLGGLLLLRKRRASRS